MKHLLIFAALLLTACQSQAPPDRITDAPVPVTASFVITGIANGLVSGPDYMQPNVFWVVSSDPWPCDEPPMLWVHVMFSVTRPSGTGPYTMQSCLYDTWTSSTVNDEPCVAAYGASAGATVCK